MVVKGLYPSSMIYAWREYKRSGKSDKLNPNLFPANQSFLLLFAENGGISLKEYKITTILQAYSIVYQLFMALAVAEFRLSFEHRDLNCENILITSVDWIDTIRSKFDGSEVYIYAHGARVKIINSSFCRMTKGTSTIYFDWASNEEFFMGEGDFEHIAYHNCNCSNVSEAKKIAEGVYSEIFVAEYKMETVILKLIPVGDDKPIDGCYISSFREGVAKLVVLERNCGSVSSQAGLSTEGLSN
ncbi:hypothetical protein WUBG_16058 [Wuchereria bancrofti]|uniref:Protein kinase domain-containing protein n=1 Tax=Wuchereria bancrofti TaxID=6293 RepID=J9ECD2_WUCBA|nr:hypothetical protein WUBG_16058 [Wuchereria bancrofti]